MVFGWRKTVSHRFRIGCRASSGRCLSLTMTLDSGQLVDIVTVYFPCFSSSAEYSAELNECLSFIENVCTDGHDVILLGDMNFECSLSNAGFRQCESVLSIYGVHTTVMTFFLIFSPLPIQRAPEPVFLH